ncbi:hypothetical protein OPT61_g1827 [Boeremia exigua]|uniref:Uncharacterized protein n=1 Tax=Boeremia exigua TaxID=749465 RepID=A0ACC2IP37_9PLEO|nr:hypothetical protein OPT61_g1827 [Boeremia exigua]
MVTSLRTLARAAFTSSRPNASRPTLTFYQRWKICPTSRRLCLHTSTPSTAAPANQSSLEDTTNSKSAVLERPHEDTHANLGGRHPRVGFAPSDFPHLVYIKLPRTAREKDVKALIARAGLQDAQISMFYHFETGKPTDSCFLRIADAGKVNAAIAALSQFTLFGCEISPERFNSAKLPPKDPLLLEGWLPSPSSDVSSRLIRPPMTQPPKLLSALLAEQWVAFMNLNLKKETQSQVAHEFYKSFYPYDVVGITKPKLKTHGAKGWTCRILFGNRADAKAARALHLKGRFMGRPGQAKIYRGGPEIHTALLKYQNSLPEDTPSDEVVELLEEKYRQIVSNPEEVQRYKDFPTPESAIGVKSS